MKQTLYEKIKIIVESGNIAITKGADGHYYLWSSITSTGSIRCSDTNKILDECYDTLGSQLTTKSMIIVDINSSFMIDVYLYVIERKMNNMSLETIKNLSKEQIEYIRDSILPPDLDDAEKKVLIIK